VSNPLDYLYEFVAWVLKGIYGFLSPVFGPTSGWTWALSIIILVVIMRLIMVPLFIKQMHTTRAMSALAPEMSALRKKYKDDKQTLQQETMKLYQQAGVNPLMGCLPIALQFPLFISLFSVLRALAEYKYGKPLYGLTLPMVQSAQKAKIFGATIGDKLLFPDGLHVPLEAKLVILVAVLISMSTTFLTVRQSMKRGMMPAATPDNPMASSQKYMAYIMPLFALTGLYWQFGLVLYWVTTNVWTLGQQWVLTRKYPRPAAAGADAAGAGARVAGVASALTGRAPTASPKRGGVPAGNGSQGRSQGRRTPADGSQSAPAANSKSGAASTSQKGTQRQGAAGGQAARAVRGTQRGQQEGRPAPQGAKRDTQAESASVGAASSNGGGLLRKLGRGRAEPEPQPAEPEVKIVRQQPQRQSRSKRSGKR
jgi:YidC/Oxa1 family membrane protein insertase